MPGMGAKCEFSALFSDRCLDTRIAVKSQTRTYTIADIKRLAHLLLARIKNFSGCGDNKNEIVVACNGRLAVAAAFAAGAMGYNLVFPNALLPRSLEIAGAKKAACVLLDDCDLADYSAFCSVAWGDVLSDYERMTDPESERALKEISAAWEQADRGSMMVSQCTSGSTGAPKRITRNLLSCEGEAAASAPVFGIGSENEMVASTAPLIHSYGLCQTFLFPILRGHCVFDEMICGVSMLEDASKRADKLIFATTPAFLKRIDPEIRFKGCIRVISAGGILPQKALKNAQTVFGLDSVTEIYGCTETGAIAYRKSHEGGEPAIPLLGNKVSALRDGAIVSSGTGTICLYSPYTADSPFLGDDVINVREDGSFDIIGRSGRIVKIEDVRISLDEIEHALREDPKIADAAVIAYRRGERVYVGAVAALENPAQKQREENGHGAFFKEIRTRLRGKIIDLSMPRKIIIAEELPHLANGKTDYPAISMMFSQEDSENP